MGRHSRRDQHADKGQQVTLVTEGVGSWVLTPLDACAVDVTCRPVLVTTVDCAPAWTGNHTETTRTELCVSSCRRGYATGFRFLSGTQVRQCGPQSCESLMKI